MQGPERRRLFTTLEQINDERAISQLDAWDTERRASRAPLSQLDNLAHQATHNLANSQLNRTGLGGDS